MPTMQYTTFAEFDAVLAVGIQRYYTIDTDGLVNVVAGWNLGVLHVYQVKAGDRMQPTDPKLTGARLVAGIRED